MQTARPATAITRRGGALNATVLLPDAQRH